MTRPTFKTRTIRLVGETQRETAIAMLNNLPLDAEHPLEIVAREEVKARGLDANGLYWLRLTEIADQAWFNKRQFSKEVWHEFARQNLMPEQIVTKDGEVKSKWVEMPSGSSVVISTTLLERKCFSDYIEAVTAFGAGLGVMFSEAPNRG